MDCTPDASLDWHTLGDPGCHAAVTEVKVQPSEDASVTVTVGILGSSLTRVGDEGDGTYTVHLIGQAQGECQALSCLEKYRTRIKRLR
jgi:hypothetical protein